MAAARAQPGGAAQAFTIIAQNIDQASDGEGAICQDTGANAVRFGDASVGASQGVLIQANAPGATLDTTDAVYAYAAATTTAACQEVTR